MRNGAKPMAALLLIATALHGCGRSDQDEGVGGVTKGEADALNEAAQMLDSRAANVQAALRNGAAE